MDYCHIVGVGGVATIERDLRIPQNVLVLLAPFERIDEDELPLVVDAGLSDVRRTLGPVIFLVK
ncbi:hypothetical protein AUI06_04290 [archaeon 13_2_20CM_2_52_21]|nr:MAG: hypothetical protein AUI06_04290 [archaeon 13_2_20CM_2_52_21]